MPDVTKLVNATQLDADLTSVANAIRTKSGGSSSLAFPSGFVSEIGNIPSGGGGGITENFPTAGKLRIYYDIADNYSYDGVDISIYYGNTAFAKTTLLHTEQYCLGINWFDVTITSASSKYITVVYTNYKNYGGYTPKIVLCALNDSSITYDSWDNLNGWNALPIQYQLNVNSNETTFKLYDNMGYAYTIHLAAEYED